MTKCVLDRKKSKKEPHILYEKENMTAFVKQIVNKILLSKYIHSQ